jgi:nucleoside-diphosphate-sugar epimerase
VVLTSSFGSVLDMSKPEEMPWKYISDDWNPITYDEAASPHASAREAYRGSKTLAEQEAWKFMRDESPGFDLVTLCPSMVFGPLAQNPQSLADLNESNRMLWKVASGSVSEELPPCQFNFWIDVRDLAQIHVQALFTPAAGGKRYIPVSREPFTYQMASDIMQSELPFLKGKIPTGIQAIKKHVEVDLEPMERYFPSTKYTPFKETVSDFVRQFGPFLEHES